MQGVNIQVSICEHATRQVAKVWKVIYEGIPTETLQQRGYFPWVIGSSCPGVYGWDPHFQKYQSQEQNSVRCIVADDDVGDIVSGLGEFKMSLCKGLRFRLTVVYVTTNNNPF